MLHTIVPPYLLTRLAEGSLAEAAGAARRTLAVPRDYQPRPLPPRRSSVVAAEGPDRRVHDAQHRETLPGELVRSEGEPAVGDEAVDKAFDGLGDTYAFLQAAFDRDGIDGAGGRLVASVHFGQRYDNAFWDGAQMVFGDGDGEVFTGFTNSLSVIAHELGHGVTEHAGGLTYQGQSGALNESISDVFGALAEQFRDQQTADRASWLIGAGIFTDQVQGRALRSMAAPGTAYDDDVLGRDPQPGSMADYVETSSDNGGVHLNSGIPNRAFHLVATRLGGFAWERAGLIWYRTLTGGALRPDADFATFAELTRQTAAAEYGEASEEAAAVTEAWRTVGVSDDAGADPR